MSVITSNWMPSQAEAPAGHPMKAGTEFWREVEFRAALDGFLADYREHLTTGQPGRRPHRARLAILPRPVAVLRYQTGEPARTD